MGALLAYDALISNENTLSKRTQSFFSNTAMLSPLAAMTAGNNGETNGSVVKKPRRTSSHTPPSKGLEVSHNLRLSLSSGNIRENVDPNSDEIMCAPPVEELEDTVLESPNQLSRAERLQKFSFETSLSMDSVDHAMFDFEVSKFFAFGSPIGLVLAYRRFMHGEDRTGNDHTYHCK